MTNSVNSFRRAGCYQGAISNDETSEQNHTAHGFFQVEAAPPPAPVIRASVLNIAAGASAGAVDADNMLPPFMLPPSAASD